MNRLHNYSEGLLGRPFLQVQPPNTGEATDPAAVQLLRTHSALSPGCIAAQEGAEHGLLQALLVLPAPGDHSPITVRRVQMVAVTGKREAHDWLV